MAGGTLTSTGSDAYGYLKRAFDVLLSGAALLVLSPLLAAVAVAVPLASPGPALYRARRVGLNGAPFTMYKFRTMHVGGAGAPITAGDDPRVFPLGKLLRRLKVDELPQLVNVLKGDMSIVGPRPEDPDIVARHYSPAHMETLAVRPGLTSPGSVYYYAVGEETLRHGDAVDAYVERLLPVKLALDLVYVREASLAYDLALVVRTAAVIAARAAGRRRFPDPPELARARQVYGFL
ncbi:MAG TPA: sugar transferase [Trueperaceae bacterium]|nr:sugar transferase [Trueperaceae bacterium]